jgi:hypothetical protein
MALITTASVNDAADALVFTDGTKMGNNTIRVNFSKAKQHQQQQQQQQQQAMHMSMMMPMMHGMPMM